MARKAPHSACEKEAILAEMRTQITNTEKGNDELRTTLTRLVDIAETDKKESNKRFETISTQMVEMNTTLKLTVENGEKALKNQESMLVAIQNQQLAQQSLDSKCTKLEESIATIIKITDERYEKLKKVNDTTNARLVTLEQHKHTVLAIGSLILSLITAVGLLAQFIKNFR